MKTRLILFLGSLLTLPMFCKAQEGNPVPCSAVKLVNIATNESKRRILFEFIRSSEQNGTIGRHNKGIVHVTMYTDWQGKERWELIPVIDDRYKDNPPAEFMDFSGDIVLIYHADSTGRVNKSVGDVAAMNSCLEQIIGDRVFLRPTRKDRWTNQVLPITNKKLTRGASREYTGNTGEVIIIFNTDGTYSKLYPA